MWLGAEICAGLRNQTSQLLATSVSCTRKRRTMSCTLADQFASFLERGGVSSDPTRAGWEVGVFSWGVSNSQWNPAQLQDTLRPTAWSQLGLCPMFCWNSSSAWPTCWCSSHRIDLCAKKLEDQQNVQSILRMVRRLSSHVASSTAAQGHMKALTKVITEDSEKDSRSTSGFSYTP